MKLTLFDASFIDQTVRKKGLVNSHISKKIMCYKKDNVNENKSIKAFRIPGVRIGGASCIEVPPASKMSFEKEEDLF